jgi:hypothetical protein
LKEKKLGSSDMERANTTVGLLDALFAERYALYNVSMTNAFGEGETRTFYLHNLLTGAMLAAIARM